MQLTTGTRITWRTMHGARSGRIVGFIDCLGAYWVKCGGPNNAAKVSPQDIIKIYNH